MLIVLITTRLRDAEVVLRLTSSPDQFMYSFLMIDTTAYFFFLTYEDHLVL
jgi:hypothetical protein